MEDGLVGAFGYEKVSGNGCQLLCQVLLLVG